MYLGTIFHSKGVLVMTSDRQYRGWAKMEFKDYADRTVGSQHIRKIFVQKIQRGRVRQLYPCPAKKR